MAHHLDADGFEFAEAVASHQRVGVVVAADHSLDAFLDDEVCTWRCFAVVRARLEVDVQCGTMIVAFTQQRIALRVVVTVLLVIAFTNDEAVLDNDTTN